MQPRVLVEGLPELRSALRQIGGKELEKELGEVHKRIGEMVIQTAGGADTGVGSGAGSTIRPSASKREVLLRVGGAHRSKSVQQWGKHHRPERGRRPYILGAALRMQDHIEAEYLNGIDGIARRHGLA